MPHHAIHPVHGPRRPSVVPAAILAITGAFFPISAFADWRDDVRDAFNKLAAGRDPVAAAAVLPKLLDNSVSDKQWREFFRNYFKNKSFTADLAQFWTTSITSGGPVAPKLARLSALAASEALARPLARDPASAVEALRWLHRLAPELDTAARETVLGDIEESLKSTKIDLRPALLGSNPEQSVFAMQVCLTLAEYTGRGAQRTKITRLLTLPDGTASLWDGAGVFLFDRGVLTPAHIASLGSLLSSIPPELHSLAVLPVPDALGFDPLAAGLGTSGQVYPLPLIPMTQPSNPAEFTPQVGQPVAPEFTLTAAIQVFRAIQAKQFALRPELVIRRDAILAHAGDRKARYLRRTLPPEVYVNQPDELLPQTAYLYVLDSGRAFQTALDLFNISQKDGMDAFLLLADVFSGGGNQTLLFSTDSAGIVRSAVTAAGRTRLSSLAFPDPRHPGLTRPPIPADLNFLNAIVINGASWVFQLGPRGGVVQWHRAGS